MKRRNQLRSKGGRRFKHSIRDPEHLARVAGGGCHVSNTECWGPVDPHHEPPLSQGGDDHHVVGLCRCHHMLRGKLNLKRFNLRYGVDLEAAAIEAYEGEPFVRVAP